MANTLRMKLLGEATIWLGDEPLAGLQSRTAEALLVYLACQPKPFSRQQLAEFFWEERDPEQSATNLRVALSLLRKKVGEYLTVTRHTVAFNHTLPHEIDAAEFESAAEKLEKVLASAPPSTAAQIAQLEAAVALYGGPFLAGFSLRDNRSFEEWSLLRQEQSEQKAVRLLRRLLADLTSTGGAGRALRYADQLLGINPLSEMAHRHKMLLLARDGQLTAALAQYQTCQQMLADELGIEPAPETAELAERIRRATQTSRHNLPPAPTPFVGRERELAELVAHLTNPACRLLTLLGTGGMGKTRLALEAARRLAATGYFLNGLRFVSLADVPHATLIPSAIAAELGLVLGGDKRPQAQVLEAVAGEEMLLVLDNLEPLLEGAEGEATADFLAQLLATAPHVTLLVTSRQRVQLQEEWLFDVDGLEVGTAGQLFRQTAERTQRGFAPSAEDVAAIAAICQTLEGLPLAIELAAGWLRQMSCAAIAHELQASIGLLTTTLRNVPARHRSMTAVFDHSWALLTAEQGAILAKLSCFAGGFTAEAAQVVAGAARADLAALGEQSLVRWEGTSGRYSLHELLRQYGAGRLAALGLTETIAEAHGRYFVGFLGQQGDGEGTAERRAIRAELPNVRAAWLWAARQGREADLLAMCAILHNFYSVESGFHEGVALFQEALALLPEPVSPLLGADLRGRMARMLIHMGQIGAAKMELEGAIAAVQQVDDPVRLSTILGYVAITAFYAGEFGRAIGLAEESLGLATAADDLDGQAFALNFLGSCHKAVGDYGAAEGCFGRAVGVYEVLGDDLGRAMTLNNLGNLAQARGDFPTARAHYMTCSQLFLAQNHLHGAATTLANAGRLARKMGDLGGAEALLQESLELKRTQKDGRGTAVALIGLADVAVAGGEFGAAQAYLAEGLALAEAAGDVKLGLEGEGVRVGLARAVGRWEEAERLAAVLLANPALSQEVREQVLGEIERGDRDRGERGRLTG
ncbi:MAG: tetratricopeptide repeat protein [Chloroflexi bacterium]|nr:tetratricopeptide repeat protein [Chloroflexota bacterium]